MSGTRDQKDREEQATPSLLVLLGIWFAILCWGSAYVAARFLLQPETPSFIPLSPLLLAALRFSIASLFFIPPFVRAILKRHISLRLLLLLSLLGQLTFTLYYFLQYIGIEKTSAGIAAILGVVLIPLFTTLIAQLLREERFRLQLVGWLVLGFLGVTLIVFQHPFTVIVHTGYFLGAVCLIVNTFLFALYNNLSKRWMREISPLVLTSGTMISGAIGLVLLSLFDPLSQWKMLGLLHLTQWLAVLFLALFCSVLSYFTYNFALSKIEASRVAVYFYFEPLVSLALGVLLLGEQLTWQTVVGALVISGAVVAVQHMQH